jgi:hypothetical protein
MMLFPAGCRRRRGILATCAVDRPGPASQKGCLTVRSLLPYHMRRLANPDNLATTLRPRRMDGRGPRCGPARVTTLLEEVIAPRPTADGAYD